MTSRRTGIEKTSNKTSATKVDEGKRPLELPDGTLVEAHYPVIVSASRSTDIPAFYADWFFKRLEAGYSVWTNPFNGKPLYVAYKDTRFIVFWSKNPAPLLPYLDTLRQKEIGCYIQFTLNDYVSEGYEPNVPSLEDRLETFRELSRKLGKQAVIWRCDPLMLTDKVRPDDLLRKIERLGDALHGHTGKLVFSFVDISCYKKVLCNMRRRGVNYEEWTQAAMHDFASKLKSLNDRRGWGYELATCAESINLDSLGIMHNRCIDDGLMVKMAYGDKKLMDHLGYEIGDRPRQSPQQMSLLDNTPKQKSRTESNLTSNAIDLGNGRYAIKKTRANKIKDSGQRSACGCIKSKDIGQYNTCLHFCAYCYANWRQESVQANYDAHLRNSNAENITSVIVKRGS